MNMKSRKKIKEEKKKVKKMVGHVMYRVGWGRSKFALYSFPDPKTLPYRSEWSAK